MKILIVDDDAGIRNVIKKSLIDAGFKVIGEAVDGEEGLEKYKELKPDLVILDILMPKLDGLSCLEGIKEYDDTAKVIICSVVGSEDIVYSAKEMGALCCITKPFDISDLIKKIKEVESTL